MIVARLLGLEGETVKDMIALPDPTPREVRFARPRRAPLMEDWESKDLGVELGYIEAVFRLERILGSDDGGPLAIYREQRR